MKNSLKEITLFAMLGAVMYASKVAMASLPNVHLIAMFIVVETVVYRKKALYPIAVYVLLEGLFGGFSIFWFIPYLYLWPLLWAVVMLLPRNMKKTVAIPVYSIVAGLHGLLFGTLFAPWQALMFHLSFEATLAWIATGFPYDCIHGASNFIMTLMAWPLIRVFEKMNHYISLPYEGGILNQRQDS